MKFYLWLALFLHFTMIAELQGQAQNNTCNATLHGKITDESNHELEGATVYILETGRGSIVEADGHFEIKNICSNTYTIRVQHLGHQTQEFKQHIAGYTEVVFKLHTEQKQLSQVVVATEKIQHPTHAVTQVSGKALDATRGLSLGESLQQIAGVNVLQTGPSVFKPIIHGLHSNRIVIVNNGIRQEGQQWGQEHAPEIDPFVANKLTVVKGAAGVRYGPDAIGGVILVEPKDLPTTPGLGGEVNIAAFSNGRQGVLSGMLEGKTKRFHGLSWRVQGSGKRAGNFHTPDYYLENTGFSEFNYSASAGYKKEHWAAELYFSSFSSKLGFLRASHVGNLSDLNLAIAQGRPAAAEETRFSYKINRPLQDLSHQLLKAKVTVKTGNLGELNAIYGIQFNQRGEYDVHTPKSSALREQNLPEIAYDLITQTADIIWEHKPIRNITGSVGLTNIFQDNYFSSRSISPLIPNYLNYTGGIFAIEKWTSSRWELEAGLRYDYRWMQVLPTRRINATVHRFQSLSASGGAAFVLNSHWLFKINASTAWRPPAPNEMYSDGVHHGTASYERGDTSLLPERAFNTIASIEHRGERFNAELNLYNNFINNYIYLSPDAAPRLTIRGAFPAFFYQQTNALLRGVDFSGSYQLCKAFVLGSKASLLWATDLQNSTYLVMMPANRLESQLTWLINAPWKINDAFLRFKHTLVDRQWRVPADRDFAAPPKGYSLLHLETGFDVPMNRSNLSTSVGASNLLNIAYRDYLNRFRYFADEPGRNIYVRLKFSF